MKNILIIASLIVVLASCKAGAKKDYVLLSGNISNPSSNNMKLSSLVSSFSKSISLNEKGSFIDTLKVDTGNYMLIASGYLAYLYLEPGDNLKMQFDSKDYKNTLKFTGKGSATNNYLKAKSTKEKEIIGNGINVYELNETDFLAKQKQVMAGLLDLVSNTKKLSKEYIEKEKRNIKYAYLHSIDNYESYHKYYTKLEDFKVSDQFLNELDGLDFNSEEDFKFSGSYVKLITNYINKKAQIISELKGIPFDVAVIQVIKEINNPVIKNQVAYNSAKYGITYTSNLEDYYTAFMNVSTNEENNKAITENYNILKKVSKGQPSPKFINYENNAGGTTSLDDLKGKYVYIDVWATWCGPCKAEIPFLQEVEKAYHGKNIEFVSISVDEVKNHDKWKNMIVEKQLGGIQLLADSDFKSQFVQDYFIKGIPKFILLDPNGNIVDSNAPRPSNKKLIELFNSLNI